MGVFSLSLLFLVSLSEDCHPSPSLDAASSKAFNSSLSAPERDRAFAEALKLCPANVQLSSGYSSLLIVQGEFARALEVSSAGLELFPSNVQLQLNKAISLYSARRTLEALAILSKLSSPEALFYRGLSQVRLAQHAEARASLRKAWELGYRDAHLLYLLIEEDHALDDKPAGLADFQNMLQQYPDSPWLHMVLGNAAFLLQKDRQARTEYEQALALDRQIPNANFRLGYLAYQAAEDELAVRYFKNELSVDPAHSDAALFTGATLRRLGRTNQAIPYLEKAVALDANSAQAYRTLATALVEMGKLQESVSILERGEKRFPNDSAFPAQLARLFAKMNRKQDAEKAGERLRAILDVKHKQDETAVNQ